MAPLHRELNAQVIAQLVFVTKVFIKEMNFILQAVYGLDDSLISHHHHSAKPASAKANANVPYQNAAFTNRIYYHFKIEIGKLSLTGITPSNTALTIYTGAQSLLVLHNNTFMSDEETPSSSLKDNRDKLLSVLDDLEYTGKPSIEAKCNVSVELKTSFSKVGDEAPSSQSTEEDSTEWYQLAYFNTKFELRNAVKTINVGLDRESIIITVEKPRFYLQPGAVDCAILFWLNYKSTYEFWLQQRQQFADFLIDKQQTVVNNSGALKSAISREQVVDTSQVPFKNFIPNYS